MARNRKIKQDSAGAPEGNKNAENTCVYRHRRLDTNEIFYVGIGNIKRPYLKGKSKRSEFWINIINKTDYEVEIIATDLSWEDACELECFLIAEYGRKDLGTGPLVNLTNGGEGVKSISKETREKMSIYAKNRTAEHTRKLSEVNKGKILTLEHKKKISDSHKKCTSRKKVIDNSTQIIYNSVNEVSELFYINSSTLRTYLTGHKKNKTNFSYYE